MRSSDVAPWGSTTEAAAAVLRETRQFYVAIDEAGTVLAWNRAATDTFSFTEEQALGANLDELIIPTSHQGAHRRGIADFLRTGHGRGLDEPVLVQAVRADGSTVPVELTIWAQRTPDGCVFHALGSDLSASSGRDRRAPKHDSADGVDRRGSAHTSTFERAGVGTWSVDIATEAMRTNSALRKIIEWPDGQPPPTRADLVHAVHPDDRPALERAVAELRGTGQEYALEHRLLLPGGRVRRMHSIADADLDAAGRVIALHGVMLDISDLRHAQTQEAEQRDNSRWILGNLTEGYALLDDDVIVEVNDALCRITGYSQSELVGSRAAHPYWPPEEAGLLEALRARARATGSASGEFNAIHRSGRRVRVAMRVTVRQPPEGGPLWLVLVRDVTDDRARERDLRSTAATDPLTGIANSRAFRPQLRAAVAEHARSGQPVSLALIDVDQFKSVNDRFGHAVGDEVLVAVVQVLAKATASVGALARVGGEEFALLMPGVDSATAHQVLREALAVLCDSPMPTVGRVTASAGVAELHDPMSDDELYRLADELLYEAKARGRNQVR